MSKFELVIPESLEIGYKDYKIIQAEKPVVLDNSICYGTISYDNQEIKLDKTYKKDQLLCTLIHEVIHGIDDDLNIGLDETAVELLGKGLYIFLKHNLDKLIRVIPEKISVCSEGGIING